ncbi:MAG: hypothetical protein ABSA76_06775 [Bacteroidales bacterium]
MANEIQVDILENNCTVSEFAKRFGITRPQVYALINAGRLSGVIISGTFYPDYSDKGYINSLLRHDKQGLWSRNYRTSKKCDENDSEFEKSWRQSQDME